MDLIILKLENGSFVNSNESKLELNDPIELVVHCLQPTWREENMDDNGY